MTRIDFDKQVERWRRKTSAKLRAVGREAVQTTVSQAQRVREEGGRMPVDTGFLRASIQAALGTWPYGPSDNPNDRTYAIGSQVAGEPLAVVLLKWEPGRDDLYVGWTANYARYQEYKQGFMRKAAMKWKTNVKVAAKKVDAGFG
jgi:hypothetical protein